MNICYIIGNMHLNLCVCTKSYIPKSDITAHQKHFLDCISSLPPSSSYLSFQNGLNALHLASKEGHVEVVAELIKQGANVDAATKVCTTSQPHKHTHKHAHAHALHA